MQTACLGGYIWRLDLFQLHFTLKFAQNAVGKDVEKSPLSSNLVSILILVPKDIINLMVSSSE